MGKIVNALKWMRIFVLKQVRRTRYSNTSRLHGGFKTAENAMDQAIAAITIRRSHVSKLPCYKNERHHSCSCRMPYENI
jgi:hypothetical protein